MRRHIIILMLVLSISVVAMAKPMGVRSIVESDSLFYEPYPSDEKAVVVESEFWNKKGTDLLGYYPQKSIVIPSQMTYVATIMGGGDAQVTLNVTEISASAFKGAKSVTSVVFTEPSNITTIGTLAFSSMSKMTGKLVLPASLTNLSVSAILLPNITEIEFFGTTPPMCEIVGTYNPWTSASNGVTPNTIKVTVPEGTWSTYKATPGIGDYFTCFQGDDPTGVTELENAPAKACKVMRNGQLLIQKAGALYTAEGNVVER